MKTTNKTIVTTAIEPICNCPYCGCEPEVEVTVEKAVTDKMSKIKHTEVYCTACGLSAPISVWQDLGDSIPEPICKDEE